MDMAKNIHPSTVQIDRLPQVKHTLEIWKRAKTSKFKKGGEQSLESPHLKRECAASLNVREHAGEKKIDMGNNI